MTRRDHHSELFERSIVYMEMTLGTLLKNVPPPKHLSITKGRVFRFTEKTLKQAIVQKLARVISAMRASEVLLDAGFIQELGALHRQVDDTCEDVLFLVFGSRENPLPVRHQEFLDSFYGEETIDGQRTGKPDLKKGEVSRQKIRAYIAEKSGDGINQSLLIDVGRTLHKAYSGYVHGSSISIMEMYGGNPPKFHVRGMNGTTTKKQFEEMMFCYYFRSFITFSMALSSFGFSPNEEWKKLLADFDKVVAG